MYTSEIVLVEEKVVGVKVVGTEGNPTKSFCGVPGPITTASPFEDCRNDEFDVLLCIVNVRFVGGNDHLMEVCRYDRRSKTLELSQKSQKRRLHQRVHHPVQCGVIQQCIGIRNESVNVVQKIVGDVAVGLVRVSEPGLDERPQHGEGYGRRHFVTERSRRGHDRTGNIRFRIEERGSPVCRGHGRPRKGRQCRISESCDG
mmetsp:Transcript_4805/g.10313  ORF Transcript_4805/g.10313 Transcript_4805/m.10313 type:complete len:201 (+) Transcript_4805:1148-1750(+)